MLMIAWSSHPIVVVAQDQDSADEVQVEDDEAIATDADQPELQQQDDADSEEDAPPQAEADEPVADEVDESSTQQEDDAESEEDAPAQAEEDEPASDDADQVEMQQEDQANDGGDAVDDDDPDDSWADAWDEDETEADDVIPIDHSRFGNDEVWQVEEQDDADGDSVGGGLASIRIAKRGPGKSVGKPPRRPGDDEDTAYSFGGLPVAAYSVPWQAQILYPAAPAQANDKRLPWQRQHYCGGALIAPDWVVTAAHCIDQQEVDLGFEVRLGTQDISRGDGVFYKIDRIVRHSQYNQESKDPDHPPNMYSNDIALVHIVPNGKPVPIDSRRVRQIPFSRTPLPPAVPVSVTGWGATGSIDSPDSMNAVLLRVDLQAMPNALCQQRPGYGPLKIRDTVFCAANPKQRTCRGDSGGPVVLTNGTPLLVGIVSWGKGACTGDGRPGVYTRIDRYAQWIDQAMKLPPGKNRLP